MHLVGPYLTTTNYKKRKQKVTKAQLAEWEQGWHTQCKRYKQIGLPRQTFEEYVDSLFGRVKGGIDKKFQPLKVTESIAEERIRKNKEMYPSRMDHSSGPNACTKRESPKYTGTLIKGIATMHKSNAVPVINQEEAEAISKMRR